MALFSGIRGGQALFVGPITPQTPIQVPSPQPLIYGMGGKRRTASTKVGGANVPDAMQKQLGLWMAEGGRLQREKQSIESSFISSMSKHGGSPVDFMATKEGQGLYGKLEILKQQERLHIENYRVIEQQKKDYIESYKQVEAKKGFGHFVVDSQNRRMKKPEGGFYKYGEWLRKESEELGYDEYGRAEIGEWYGTYEAGELEKGLAALTTSAEKLETPGGTWGLYDKARNLKVRAGQEGNYLAYTDWSHPSNIKGLAKVADAAYILLNDKAKAEAWDKFREENPQIGSPEDTDWHIPGKEGETIAILKMEKQKFQYWLSSFAAQRAGLAERDWRETKARVRGVPGAGVAAMKDLVPRYWTSAAENVGMISEEGTKVNVAGMDEKGNAVVNNEYTTAVWSDPSGHKSSSVNRHLSSSIAAGQGMSIDNIASHYLTRNGYPNKLPKGKDIILLSTNGTIEQLPEAIKTSTTGPEGYMLNDPLAIIDYFKKMKETPIGKLSGLEIPDSFVTEMINRHKDRTQKYVTFEVAIPASTVDEVLENIKDFNDDSGEFEYGIIGKKDLVKMKNMIGKEDYYKYPMKMPLTDQQMRYMENPAGAKAASQATWLNVGGGSDMSILEEKVEK